jgi:DNA-nicking Smr family endonuclease
LKKKISDKDKKDWENFINNPESLENKDKKNSEIFSGKFEKSIDLHGYTLDDANQKIFEFINYCFSQEIYKINIITGKGLRSKNLENPYQSNNLSILKYSVPDFIKKNSELMEKILKIDFDAINSPSKGSFDIFLKKKSL